MSRRPSLTPRAPGLSIARVFGIEIRVDPSWLIWPLLFAGFSVGGSRDSGPPRMLFGVLMAVLLAACIVVHELAHSVTARAYGLPVRRITLFMFGGVSQIEREAPDAATEFHIALAGPLSSLVLATVLGGVAITLYPDQRVDESVVGNIGVINLILAGFNLVPAFPMDGGRILRSALWARTKSRARATKWAARAGRSFGLLLIGAGLVTTAVSVFVDGRGIGGGNIWWALIGVFVYNAAATAGRSEGGERPNEPREFH